MGIGSKADRYLKLMMRLKTEIPCPSRRKQKQFNRYKALCDFSSTDLACGYVASHTFGQKGLRISTTGVMLVN